MIRLLTDFLPETYRISLTNFIDAPCML